MEIGNALFGNSRGEALVPRIDEWRAPVEALFEAMGISSAIEFDCELFTLFPYYWGDCTCGFADVRDAWEETHDHAVGCYQLAYRALPSDPFRPYFKMDDAAKLLCELRGIDWNGGRGSAAHCDCGHDSEWEEFLDQNRHAAACPIVRPNFIHKPTGFTLKWYKYPLRDSYMTPEVTLAEWTQIFADCVEYVCRNSTAVAAAREAYLNG